MAGTHIGGNLDRSGADLRNDSGAVDEWVRAGLRQRAATAALACQDERATAAATDAPRQRAQRSAVLAPLSALPAKQREVLVLRYYADLSEAQIAAAMGISRGSVKSHATGARDSLRDILGTHPEPRAPRQPRAPLGHRVATGPGH